MVKNRGGYNRGGEVAGETMGIAARE